jgi:hypothetical protein
VSYASVATLPLDLSFPEPAAWPRPTVEEPGPEPQMLAEITQRADGAHFCTDWQGRNPRRFKSHGQAAHYQGSQGFEHQHMWSLWRTATLAPRLRPVIPMVEREHGFWASSLGTIEAAAWWIESQEQGEVGELDDERLVVVFCNDPTGDYDDLWADALRWLVYDAIMADSQYGEDWPEQHPDLLRSVSEDELAAFDLAEVGVTESGWYEP